MRILLSNDDGIFAQGIQTLATALRHQVGIEQVQIVAPCRNRSGASNALTLDSPLRIQRHSQGDIAVVQGTPVDCVYLGVNTLMQPRPDIVIAGINAGPNLGDDVIYSGTVAAATEGRHLGLPAIAVSLNGHQYYQTAAEVTCRLVKALTHFPLAGGRILNINVPDLPIEQIKGYRMTRCGRRHPSCQVITQQDPRGETIYWIGPLGEKVDAKSDTDFAAIEQGFVSITVLSTDMTAYNLQEDLSHWLVLSGVQQPC